MARKTVEIFPGRDFGIVHDIDEKPHKIDFQLHNHNDLYHSHNNVYEVVLLLDGDCEFCVEGNTYRLEPRDIVYTSPFEMHKMVCLSERTYNRMILYIKSSYFDNNNCEQFRDIFENRLLGVGNCISRNIADRALKDCISRLYLYAEEKAYDVAERTVFEFLYLINECKGMSDNLYVKDKRVREMIMYINEHLSENLSLDKLAKEFFVAKNYMCKVFKKNTGHTINQYINSKRIMLVQELHQSGQNLMQASLNAGFNSYANFYKAYVKQTGESPREMTK